MKKIISASFLAALALTMLLPVAGQVNATSVNHSHPAPRRPSHGMPGGAAAAATTGNIPLRAGRRRRPLQAGMRRWRTLDSVRTERIHESYLCEYILCTVRVRSGLMNHLENLLLLVNHRGRYAILCGFVFASKVQRILPFFAAYSFVAFGQRGRRVARLRIFGFRSLAAYYCYWISLLLNAGMRSLAIAELCRYKLRAYRGIWGLVWRVLAVLSMLFLLHAAIDAWGQPNRLAIYSLTLDRDLDIASVAILAVLLLIHNYYGLSLEPLQRRSPRAFASSAPSTLSETPSCEIFSPATLFPFFAADQQLDLRPA